MGRRGKIDAASLEKALERACEPDDDVRAPTPLESALRDAADTPTSFTGSLRPRAHAAPTASPRLTLDSLPFDDTVIGEEGPVGPEAGPSTRPTARSIRPSASRLRAGAAWALAAALAMAVASAVLIRARSDAPNAAATSAAVQASSMEDMLAAADVEWNLGHTEIARTKYAEIVRRFPGAKLPDRVRERAGR
jgi:hypothetical protein